MKRFAHSRAGALHAGPLSDIGETSGWSVDYLRDGLDADVGKARTSRIVDRGAYRWSQTSLSGSRLIGA
jgi:hypothetical protein